MARMQQMMENVQNDDFSEKLERAKQIYCLLNNVTFGNEIESKKSKVILRKII